MEILKPFGPSIVKTKIPNEMIDRMNEYVEEVIEDSNRQEKLDYGHKLAGNVRQEFLLENDFLKKIKWADFLALNVKEWLKTETDKELKHLHIKSSWIVRQFKDEYNPIHYHGGHISGVGYLKVPSYLGEKRQEKKKVNNNGKLVLIHGSKNLLCNATYPVTPRVGDFYLFPNYLLHAVWPFTSTEEERRSISFNATLDEEASTY